MHTHRLATWRTGGTLSGHQETAVAMLLKITLQKVTVLRVTVLKVTVRPHPLYCPHGAPPVQL